MGGDAIEADKNKVGRAHLRRDSSTISSRSLLILIQRHPLLFVFVVAFLGRVGSALMVGTIFPESPVLDDTTYSRMAEEAAAGLTERWDGYTHFLFDRSSTLLVPITGLYKLFGPELILAQLFVALFGAATAVLVTRLAMEGLETKWAIAAGLVTALLPSQILWSSLVLKDALVWFLLAGLALLIAVASRSRGRALLMTGGAMLILLFLLAHLREHTLVVASWGLVIASWFGIREMRPHRLVAAVSLAIAIPWVVGIGPGGYSLVTDAGSLAERRAQAAAYAQTAVVPPSVGVAGDPSLAAEDESVIQALARRLDVDPEKVRLLLDARAAVPDDESQRIRAIAARLNISLSEARKFDHVTQDELVSLEASQPQPEGEAGLEPNLRHLPRGVSVMLAEPFPWQTQSGSASFNMARAETAIYYPVLLIAALGIPALWRKRRMAIFPLVTGVGILLMYALAEGNIGTAYRHRGEFIWVIALSFAFGIFQLSSWISRRRLER